ncbi:MAG: monovalent cation/H(+) antiporter subunit G [Alphaproteobacteria bacterium]|nr:MAG: monovalent cation/H(+) antiporter subunit G [Alphaproteobacteria bacterium]
MSDFLGGVLILAGAAIIAVAALGLLRLPDPFTRMHAATKAGVLGAGLTMLGVGIALGSIPAVMTGVAGMVFLLATSPLASHALGRAAYISGAPLAPATFTDALAGVLPRNVIDITPGRVVRRSATAAEPRLTAPDAVSPIPFGSGASPMMASTARALAGTAPAPLPMRSITAWLVGGPHQSHATAFALSVGRDTGAAVTGFSAIDSGAADPSGPVPIGGAAWSHWCNDARRQRQRDHAIAALSDFERQAGTNSVGMRHLEDGFDRLIAVAGSSDLTILPALVDSMGEPARFDHEIADRVSLASATPVVRVRHVPQGITQALVIVADTPRCGHLGVAVTRLGLWRDVDFHLLPLGAADGVATVRARETAALMQQHGYTATVLAAHPPALDVWQAQRLVQGYPLVVMARLSNRRGVLAMMRTDLHEIATDQAPLILLP